MQEEEVQIVTASDASVIYQQDRATIDVQISTAKAYPRNITKATDNAIAVVSMDRETAATCTYSIPRGGKKISGPSVHLAKILAQYWGNLRVEAKVVDIGHKQITSQATAFDLETNLAIKVEVKRSIVGKSGRFNEDMITVTGNAANAIALRNAVYAVIPRAVVDKVYKAALNVITGDVSDDNKLIARRKEVVDRLKDTYDVTEVEIVSAIGKASINHITRDDLVVLIGIGQAIRDGDTTVDAAFRAKQEKLEDIDIEDLKILFGVVKVHLTEAEATDAERIIKNSEKLSYLKLHKFLRSRQDEKQTTPEAPQGAEAQSGENVDAQSGLQI